MLKKILLTLLLVGFTGFLIWGGVNRTLAKSGEDESHASEINGNGSQGWSADHDQDSGQEEGYRGGQTADQGEASEQGRGHGYGSSNGGETSEVSVTADVDDIEAIYLALDAEYNALAVYQSAVETFGSIEPFAELAGSNQHHIAALSNQLEKNSLDIPENPWIGEVPAFESVEAACQAGAQIEIDNAALYQQLIGITDDASLTRIFSNILSAAQNNHLPELEACQ
jgi:hypothetical protein